MPTEAEWEYAARGGNKSKGFRFSGSDDLNSVAWFIQNSESITHNVGSRQKMPNELGIYDMSGNVWEWSSDVYRKYSKKSQSLKESQPSKGSNFEYEYYVIRGGGMNSEKNSCGVSSRATDVKQRRLSNCGFRLVFSTEEVK